jgi:AraC-like DNA-binding protein
MTEPMLTVVDAALRGTLLALLLLQAAALWRDRPHLPAARAGIVMCLGLSVQVVSSTPLVEASLPLLWQAPWIAVSVGNAVLFWVFVQALFDDEFVLKPLHAAAWLAAAGLSGIHCIALADPASPLAAVTLGLQRSVPLLFAVLAVVAAAAHWRDDLVEERRRVRIFIVVAGVVYTLAMLVARLASPHGRLSAVTSLIDSVALLVIVAVTAWRLLRVGGSDLFPSAPGSVAAGVHGAAPQLAAGVLAERAGVAATPLLPDPAEERLAGALQRLMAHERVYRSEDLSVASLAARLVVPEYRLRRLINQRLGHRNFNAYVNGFRLDDARSALADPALRERPVLSIALDAGFQSIGPFNRAFKATTGLTPTEFRRGKLADS